jgi:hypothetical protein
METWVQYLSVYLSISGLHCVHGLRHALQELIKVATGQIMTCLQYFTFPCEPVKGVQVELGFWAGTLSTSCWIMAIMTLLYLI